ncbi:nucleoside diphosphate kinase regulator [Ciceribacter sp. L1K23]|uniref:nucleoside diphosphate kinase regulator n=1 Tax=Ciceribacter sp. L1K23 TaxID=2820276 RepID=UPI001B83F36E|nr:nucleoside diphosphate kinase regulator [Ciceribacter sp. L1K23]MBR0554867.1 nucleoside diphosphate kinase regulator [Ciceribacter sp. L1K23]
MTRPRIVVEKNDHDKLMRLANGLVETRPEIAEELLDELERAAVAEDAKAINGTVQMNSTVEYRTDEGASRTVTLVYPADADIAEGKVSILTPIGTALLGMPKGRTIDFTANDGRQHKLTVVSVTKATTENGAAKA